MKTETNILDHLKTEPKTTPAQTVADAALAGLLETGRRCVAIRRHFQPDHARYRRMTGGPHAGLVMVFVIPADGRARAEVRPLEWLDALASTVSDSDAAAELSRHSSAS